MVMVGILAVSGATYAWFALNNSVTATGMEVRTKVDANIFIAEDTVSNTAKKADSEFKTDIKQVVTGILEPVSTVNGMSFFYTDVTNVTSTGDAMAEIYRDYDDYGMVGASNPEYADRFSLNYDVTKVEASAATGGEYNRAFAYTDYAFQLKAINGGTENQYINLETLNLSCNGVDTFNSLNAFRVAIFVEKFNAMPDGTAHDEGVFHLIGAVDGSSDPYGTVTLLKNSAAANREATKAVAYESDEAATTALGSASTALQPVTYGSFNYLTLAPGETAYYKFVVRLYIEGEDVNCYNDTFVNLADSYELDLAFTMVKTGQTAKAYITNGTYTLLNGTTVAGAETSVNGVAGLHAVTGVTYNGLQVYANNTNLAADGVVLYVPSNPDDLSDTSAPPTVVTTYFNFDRL